MVKKQAKRLLVQALMELLEVSSIDKIDVRELTERANLSRQTFYYNFKNKQNMVEWIFSQNNEQAQKAFMENYSLEDYLTTVMEIILEQQSFYSNVLINEYFSTEEMGPFEKGIVKTVQETEMLATGQHMDKTQWDALLFFAFGTKGMITYWLKNGMKMSIPSMVDCLMNNLPEPLNDYIDLCTKEAS